MKIQFFNQVGNRNGFKWIIALLLLILSFHIYPLHANWDSLAIGRETKKVQFMIEIPLWFLGLRSSFSIGDITLEGNGKLKDIFSQYFNAEGSIDYYFVGIPGGGSGMSQ